MVKWFIISICKLIKSLLLDFVKEECGIGIGIGIGIGQGKKETYSVSLV
jgi:hypothetical protein